MLRFGAPTVPAEVSVYALNVVDRFYLFHAASPGKAGLYSLAVKLGEIGEADRVDVIMTNPPFGGEEQRGIADGLRVSFSRFEPLAESARRNVEGDLRQT